MANIRLTKIWCIFSVLHQVYNKRTLIIYRKNNYYCCQLTSTNYLNIKDFKNESDSTGLWTVLSHPAVGGFVSHCGWNLMLENIWSGVPMATWPLHAEQQMNAFQVAKELGIAVEICLDYFEENKNQQIARAEQVEKGVRDSWMVNEETVGGVKSAKIA